MVCECFCACSEEVFLTVLILYVIQIRNKKEYIKNKNVFKRINNTLFKILLLTMFCDLISGEFIGRVTKHLWCEHNGESQELCMTTEINTEQSGIKK